ncbi:MAG: DNA recombination protein RmuC [Brockia lithotrophica]|nr:DNA recombination protein RmuC [Brockia lithotrophica]
MPDGVWGMHVPMGAVLVLVVVAFGLGWWAARRLSLGGRASEDRVFGTLDRLARSLESEQRTFVQQMGLLSERLMDLVAGSEGRLERLEARVAEELHRIRDENERTLESLRRTVDEKLETTLEARLGASFRLVSERLEEVHRGLGEMRALAEGVGDLRRILANVKRRGVLGEVQLENILADILLPEQYARDVRVNPNSEECVDFAVRLPGRTAGEGIWLPIDAKFPLADVEAYLAAEEAGDPEAVRRARRRFVERLRLEAQKVREKYIVPPHTTDFALLFLPFESLYAEALREPGLFETLQREWRVVLVGPTTLAAILHSLSLGLRTVAIERRAGEVWELLRRVQADFARFADLLSRTRRKLDEALRAVDAAELERERLSRRLRGVLDVSEELPDRALEEHPPTEGGDRTPNGGPDADTPFLASETEERYT